MALKQHTKIVVSLTGLVLLMFAFAFALVPLYNSLCKTLGINGKLIKPSTANATVNGDSRVIDHQRLITVEFVATQASNLPWSFYPKIKKITIHPGEIAKLAFYAENQSDHNMTVQAIPSVTPGIAAKYIKKTECFCFTQQNLNAHEAMNMPLLFNLDIDLPSNINTITLAYTLFDVTNHYAQTESRSYTGDKLNGYILRSQP